MLLRIQTSPWIPAVSSDIGDRRSCRPLFLAVWRYHGLGRSRSVRSLRSPTSPTRTWPASSGPRADGLKSLPDLPMIYLHRGQHELSQGDLRSAETDFAAAVQKAPHFTDPLKAWGDVSAREGRWQQAVGSTISRCFMLPLDPNRIRRELCKGCNRCKPPVRSSEPLDDGRIAIMPRALLSLRTLAKRRAARRSERPSSSAIS